MGFKFNPISGQLDLVGGTTTIPQYNADPTSPNPEDVWVRKTGGLGVAGTPLGLLLALTDSGTGGTPTYDLRYRTKEGTTIGVALT